MRLWSSLIAFFTPLLLHAATLIHPAPASPGNGQDAMMANSPFTVYTAGVVGYVLLTIVLVLTLLVGAFLVVNLGMMSRREQDEQYKTTPEPSDLGILKGERFNRIVNERPKLPAEPEPGDRAKETKKDEERKRRQAA